MLDIVDAAFSYEKELIACSFLQNFSMGKGSSFGLICNAHTAFCEAERALSTRVTKTLLQ